MVDHRFGNLGYRQKEWEAEQIIYVTDGRQETTLNNYSSPLKSGTQPKQKAPALNHVWFGTILGEDNKAIKTRDEQPIKLIDLLERRWNEHRNGQAKKCRPARKWSKPQSRIGLGAVKYADRPGPDFGCIFRKKC